jgi:hypothetical protein
VRGTRSALFCVAGALAVVAGAPSHPASTQWELRDLPDTTDYRAFPSAHDGTRDSIVAQVQRRYKARVVRVTDTTYNGRPALELRLLSEQRVWTVVVDASTGQVLSGDR